MSVQRSKIKLEGEDLFLIIEKETKMRKFGVRILVMSITTFLFMSSVSYPMGQYPKVEREDQEDLKGTYTVIFYGGTYSNDPETVALLDVEDDEYTFEPFTSEYNYQIKKGIPAELALKESRWFVGRHSDYFTSSLKRVIDSKGSIIGYELKPLFYKLRFGYLDILDVSYWFKDDKVLVSVDLKRKVKERFNRNNFSGD
jgi:hypothetical protein